MKVVGFTIIRNAEKFDYPVVESIQSILPLCDSVYVGVGNSEDNTRAIIEQIDPDKIKIIDTVWDDSLREGGRVLAEETNKIYRQLPKDADWAIYIQADEVLHENDYSTIRSEMAKEKDNAQLDALVFNYYHFYGSYDYIGNSKNWYRREARIIRISDSIFSYRDAQGFRKNANQKLNGKLIASFVYHYGWVKHPKLQQAKQSTFHKMWHDDNWVNENVKAVDEFDYSEIDNLAIFQGDHPDVMRTRIQNVNWKFSFDPTKRKTKFKYKLVSLFEKITGIRLGEFRNYKLIK